MAKSKVANIARKIREAKLRMATWLENESPCPICDQPFRLCDHTLAEATAQLRRHYEDARLELVECRKKKQAERDAQAAFSVALHFHDIRERKPFDDVEPEWKGMLYGHFLVLGIWDPEEPSPDAEICMVSYSDKDDIWRYIGGKPWPFAHRIRYWAQVPWIEHDEMGEEQRNDFMSAPEKPE